MKPQPGCAGRYRDEGLRATATRDDILSAIRAHPIIAAVRQPESLDHALAAPPGVIFLMTGDILTVQETVERIRDAGKRVMVHVDLLKGLAADREGILYLAKEIRPDGVVSTRIHLLQSARKAGLLTVQHLFMIDTHALETGVSHVRQFGPDIVEVMPGLMPRVVRDLSRMVDQPIVAAGLITSFAEVEAVIDAGATAAVASREELWDLAFA